MYRRSYKRTSLLSLYKVIFDIFKISEKINKKNFFTKLKKGLWIETLAFII